GQALSGNGKGGGGDAAVLGGLSDKGRGGGRVGTGLGAAGNGDGIIGGSSRVALRSGGGEEAVVMGSIDKSAIEAAIMAHKDEFRLCYEKEINAENPNVSGMVRPSFTIGASGRVTENGIQESTIRNANVERCVLTVLKRIQFPAPVGGVVQVTYPFRFEKIK
ncbi:MAG: energy transducer TonB, partial [Proteobacteria bacterium]